MWTLADYELSFTGKDRERKILVQSNVNSFLLAKAEEQLISTVLGHKHKESIPNRVTYKENDRTLPANNAPQDSPEQPVSLGNIP